MYRKTFILLTGFVLSCILLYSFLRKEEIILLSSEKNKQSSISVENGMKGKTSVSSLWHERRSKDRKDRRCLPNGVIRPVAPSEKCPITMNELKAFHERITQISEDADDYEEQIEEAMALLQGTEKRDLAALLSQLAADGELLDRMKVLDLIGLLWETREAMEINIESATEELSIVEETIQNSADKEEVIPLGDLSDESPNDKDTDQGEDIVADILAGCLSDGDFGIRSQAVELLAKLPKDVSNDVSFLVLSGDFSDVKKLFLEQHEGSDDFHDMSLFFHALDDQDDEIVDYARKNISAVLNMDFTSSPEAFEWWEHSQTR